MRPSNRSEVVRVKDTPAEKSYTIKYRIEALTQSELDVLTEVMEVPKVADIAHKAGIPLLVDCTFNTPYL